MSMKHNKFRAELMRPYLFARLFYMDKPDKVQVMVSQY